MTTPKYDVDYFIRKLTRIPKDKWIVGGFKDPNGRCCALGHLGMTQSTWNGPIHTPASEALLGLLGGYKYEVFMINDDHHPKYSQSTPRARVLAALKDLKAGKYIQMDNTPYAHGIGELNKHCKGESV